MTVSQEAGAGLRALTAFRAWMAQQDNASLEWADALEHYRAKLRRDGLSNQVVKSTLQLVMAYDEGEFHDEIHTGDRKFKVLLRNALSPGEK